MARVVEAAVGINLEDAGGRRLREIPAQVRCIEAARKAADTEGRR